MFVLSSCLKSPRNQGFHFILDSPCLFLDGAADICDTNGCDDDYIRTADFLCKACPSNCDTCSTNGNNAMQVKPLHPLMPIFHYYHDYGLGCLGWDLPSKQNPISILVTLKCHQFYRQSFYFPLFFLLSCTDCATGHALKDSDGTCTACSTLSGCTACQYNSNVLTCTTCTDRYVLNEAAGKFRARLPISEQVFQSEVLNINKKLTHLLFFSLQISIPSIINSVPYKRFQFYSADY